MEAWACQQPRWKDWHIDVYYFVCEIQVQNHAKQVSESFHGGEYASHRWEVLQVNHKHLLVTIRNLLLNWVLEAWTTRQNNSMTRTSWCMYLRDILSAGGMSSSSSMPIFAKSCARSFSRLDLKVDKKFLILSGLMRHGMKWYRERIDLFHLHSWRLYFPPAGTCWMLNKVSLSLFMNQSYTCFYGRNTKVNLKQVGHIKFLARDLSQNPFF